jgi:hypothetical protein
MSKHKAELRFAIEDIVRFTSEGVERVGVIENIDGENYTVRVYAESGDDIVATDTSVTLTDADLSDYFESVEETLEVEDEEDLLKAIEQEGKARKPLSIKSADGAGQTLNNGDFIAVTRWNYLEFYKILWTPADANVVIAQSMDFYNGKWEQSDYTETFETVNVVKITRLPSLEELKAMKEAEEEAQLLATLSLLDSVKETAPSASAPTPPQNTDKAIGLDDFVEYESEGGKVCGKVNDIYTEMEVYEGMTASKEEPIVEVEVYEQGEDGLVPSGLMTYRRMSEVMMCDVPKMGTVKYYPRMIVKVKNATVEIDEESQTGYIYGDLNVKKIYDLGGDFVMESAFKRSIDHNEGKIHFMADHGYKSTEYLGTIYLNDKPESLKMKAAIDLRPQLGKETFYRCEFSLRHGKPLGLSIGYDPVQYNPNKMGGSDLIECKLYEGSVTPFPMNQESLITEASKRFNREKREKRRKLFQTLKR